MKKVMMMAVAAACMSMPAMAKDMDDSAMHKNEMVEMKAKAKFAEMDANKDGMVSKSEHDAAGTKMFSDADANKDGSLSLDEVKDAKKKEMDKMEAMKPEAGNK